MWLKDMLLETPEQISVSNVQASRITTKMKIIFGLIFSFITGSIVIGISIHFSMKNKELNLPTPQSNTSTPDLINSTDVIQRIDLPLKGKIVKISMK